MRWRYVFNGRQRGFLGSDVLLIMLPEFVGDREIRTKKARLLGSDQLADMAIAAIARAFHAEIHIVLPERSPLHGDIANGFGNPFQEVSTINFDHDFLGIRRAQTSG